MEIVWLGEPAGADRALVGGKAAVLGRLAATQRVPPGFCLTTAAFDRWAGATCNEPWSPPAELVAALSAAHRALAERCGETAPALAVRSSAVDEDGQGDSFAGQYETVLNVVGVGAVARAVARCWSSARSERTRAYRAGRGLPPDGARLAVLVQRLVVADVSAVAFSADPVSGRRDLIVINAAWGLGEGLVGGAVTPDAFVVGKADLAVAARRIADKRAMTVPTAGGVSQVETPRFLRTAPTLDDARAAEVARLALALEAATGGPVDVECAYRAGTLHLLQCRPVTALAAGGVARR
jgi:pyruvate,water dikinase